MTVDSEMTSKEKREYNSARAFLGWRDEDVAKFFGYNSLASFRRSSAYGKRRRWFSFLVRLAREKAEKLNESRLAEARKEFREYKAKVEKGLAEQLDELKQAT